jgi:hypothetical protein
MDNGNETLVPENGVECADGVIGQLQIVPKRHRSSYSLAAKLAIVVLVNERRAQGFINPQAVVAKEKGIDRSMITRWCQKEEECQVLINSHGPTIRKVHPGPKYKYILYEEMICDSPS